MKINNSENKLYKNFDYTQKVKNEVIVRDKKTQKRALIGSAIGTLLGFSVALAINKKGTTTQDIFVKGNVIKTLRNIYDYTDIDYEGLKGYFAMVLQSGGAVLGSILAAKTIDKDKRNEKEKIKQGLFTVNNVAIPAALAKLTEYGIEKLSDNKSLSVFKTINNNKFLKSITVLLGLAVGLGISLSVSNTINASLIDKNHQNKKTIKPKDLLVHIDDVIPVLASFKDGIFSKLPLGRILPFIYCFIGAESGAKNYYTKEHSQQH